MCVCSVCVTAADGPGDRFIIGESQAGEQVGVSVRVCVCACVCMCVCVFVGLKEKWCKGEPLQNCIVDCDLLAVTK